MKRSLILSALACLLTLALAGPALASPSAPRLGAISTPAVSAVFPTSATNDLAAAITITGSGFATDTTGTVPPTLTLGSTPLSDVALVDATTLTATVPWGMDQGSYPLTVTNPDGGTATLQSAFTVTSGIGTWNGSALNGGAVNQLFMKPDDPSTLYAFAYGLHGLFRSTDSGASWTYTGGSLALDNYKVSVTPAQPDWIYAYTHWGVEVSKNDGDTWSVVSPDLWPNGKGTDNADVHVSPVDADLLFVNSYANPGESATGDAQGLIRSTDGGAHWTIVSSLAGKSVMDVAFEPQDPTQMVALAQDGQVFHSSDSGATWLAVTSLPTTNVGWPEQIAYNPNASGEVWVVGGSPAGVYESTDPALDGWQDLTSAAGGGCDLSFVAPDTVWVGGRFSTDGGQSWQTGGPNTGQTAPIFDPANPQIGYIGDGTYGVQKTSDGGQTWSPADQGLTGMTCSSLSVSTSDPLRVFAAFGNWPGIYASADGAASWSYTAAPGSDNPSMDCVVADPSDPTGMRVYAVSHDAVYDSTDGGATWNDLGWNTPSPQSDGFLTMLAADPFVPGHLLASWGTGTYLSGPGCLYASSDYGATWQLVTLPQTVKHLICDIAFDPSAQGTVYFTSQLSGIYKSTDGGTTWKRIDDPKQPNSAHATTIAIATHPQHLLFVGTDTAVNFVCYRSADGGASWQRTQADQGATQYLFANGDSTRLYAATGDGLLFSSDAGDSWTAAAGAFGQLQILSLADAQMDGHTIIYAATNGGQASASAGPLAGKRAATLASSRTTVRAGIYRYVVLTPKLALKLSGLSRGVVRLHRYVGIKGLATPAALAGNKLAVRVQRYLAHHWVAAKTVLYTIRSGGSYSWWYKPARRGTYRVRVSIAKTAAHLSAMTSWHGFKVR